MERAPFPTFATGLRRTGRGTVRGTVRHAALDPQTMPVYAGLALGWGVLLVAMPLMRVSLDTFFIAVLFGVCGLLVWTAACLRQRGLMRLATGIEAWTLLNLATIASVIASYVAARSGAPLVDDWMAAADRWIAPGLDWRQTVVAVAHRPLLVHGANLIYASLPWQGSLLILLCCIAGQTDRCAAFVLRWMITLAIVITLFALFPAYGPATDFALRHADVPAIGSNAGWCAPPIMAWLRSAGAVRLDVTAFKGIITFPSFHAAGATLFAWGFWSIRWARWPMLALNVAMMASAVPIGGHYYVDVAAGVLIALCGIMLPGWIARLRVAPAARPQA